MTLPVERNPGIALTGKPITRSVFGHKQAR